MPTDKLQILTPIVTSVNGQAGDVTVATKTSELTNDSYFVTQATLDEGLNGKVDKVEGKGLSTNDLTAALKSNYDAAYTHSQTTHAPIDAEKNVIVGIQKNGTDVSVGTNRKVNITVPTKTSELNNDNNFATESYVDTKVAGLVDSAPDTLDTLNELAAALGDDPNFATTVANKIGTKVDKVDGKGLSTNDYTTEEKNKLSGIAANANNYSLPVATSSALGGVKSGTDITVDTSGNVSVNDDSHNHVISNVDGLQDALDAKVSVVSGKGLSTNDLTATLKSNYDAAYTHSTSAHAPSNAERNVIVGIQKNGTDVVANSSTRKVNITVPTKVSELENDSKYLTSHQSLANYALKTDVQASLDTKVDKVTGKSLSTNDYTTAEKNKLAGIATGAQVNSITGVKGSAESAYRTGNVNITAANIGAVPTTRTINDKALSSNITLTASDVGALSTAGGTLTGNLTGKYFTGTWLQTTAASALGSAATKICVLDGSGWVYYRTPEQILSDIGVPAAIQAAIGDAIAASY